VRGAEWTVDEHGALTETRFSDLPLVSRGKVRDVYDLGAHLLFVATDRISAFDWILPTGIPDKGRVLNQLSAFWFELFAGDVATHVHSLDLGADPRVPRRYRDVLPIECVARGYLAGSGWKDYQRTGAVCGVGLPPGLRQAERLPAIIFTPATKAETGHDENIDLAAVAARVGRETAAELAELTVRLFRKGAAVAEAKGILVADTKFEFGRIDGRIALVDEVLTPDSSRFWPADRYAPGQSPPSFDKQFVRDWLEKVGWDKNSPPPRLPADVAAETRARYVEALIRLTGRGLHAGQSP
jgi:phosphoribosylaminoimidazole-succinocarboxamide synthase